MRKGSCVLYAPLVSFTSSARRSGSPNAFASSLNVFFVASAYSKLLTQLRRKRLSCSIRLLTIVMISSAKSSSASLPSFINARLTKSAIAYSRVSVECASAFTQTSFARKLSNLFSCLTIHACARAFNDNFCKMAKHFTLLRLHVSSSASSEGFVSSPSSSSIPFPRTTALHSEWVKWGSGERYRLAFGSHARQLRRRRV
mmetsp:Transcript_20147/g.51422  ORF Transcript_20147/g.51422 Transcript_20147/m.51422 type:complete len:200 (+) Transcript_20147:2064-2663(+)